MCQMYINDMLINTCTYMVGMVNKKGALDGGVPMSHVEFKKLQCRMSLSLINPYVPCQI